MLGSQVGKSQRMSQGSSGKSPYYFPCLLGLIHVQALRNVPHLTVTWPNQHALISRRSGLVNRGHQVMDQSMVKQKSGPRPIQGPFSDNDNVASQVGTSMNLLASKAEAIVNSRSSSERLSCLSDPRLLRMAGPW
jgi:hypothetical protein